MEEEILQKVDDYKEVVSAFADVLRQENEALNDYDIKKVSALYETKAKVVSAYRLLVSYLIKNQEALNSLEKEEKEDLKEISSELNELLSTNNILLKARMETSKNVMSSIVSLAKVATKANSTSYAAGGGYSPLNSTRSAIAINRTF